MTEHPPPDDELVSAHLDGTATPDEAAAVEASAPAMARRAELDAVRARMGEPVTPPEGARDRALAAALAVYDEQRAAADPATAPAPTAVSLGDARSARAARRRRRLVPVLGAVAAVALALVAAAGLFARPPADTSASSGAASDQTVAGFAPQAESEAPQAPGSGEDGSTPLSNELAAPARAGVDLGTIADAAGLRRAVAGALAPPARAAGPAPPPPADAVAGGTASCEAARRAADPGLGPLRLAGTARYQGAPVEVLAFAATSTAPARTFLSEPATCRVVLVDPG
jgi:hypothetical protein